MKLTGTILAAAAMLAVSIGMLNAAGPDKEAVDLSALGLVNASTEISLPTPHASSVEGESVAEMDAFFKYMGDIFQAPKALPLTERSGKSATAVPDGRAGNVVYSFKLDSILNSYIDAGLSFRTPHGASIKFSGYTAANCPNGGQSCADKERFFLILSAGPTENYFVKATDIINTFITSGLKKVIIGGDELTVKIYAALTDIPSSRIEITCGRVKVFASTLAQLGNAVAGKGLDVRLGRPYKLVYGNELLQGKGGARFSENLVVILSPVGADGLYFLNRADLMPPGVTYPEMEPGYGFRIVDGTLEIFKLL
ncbi:MAG: hypothetical protein NTX59_12510 [Elusimicrobia bacterium]|nr:hypothetical protein [Elusimicrobiota bacterium]